MTDQGLLGRLRALLDEARAVEAADGNGAGPAVRAMLEEFLSATQPASGGSGPPSAAHGEELPSRYGIVGASAAMQSLFDDLDRVARSDVSVLIRGETGTGKELVARALHDASKRADRPFIAENCAAVAPSLLESELFGHKRGSFTGAVADRDGCFVAADGGTLFLDEVGDMPLPMQAKLLRVLEEGELRPIGASKTRRVDVRVLAATNRDLDAMVAEKSFRQDLFYRLDVVTLRLPPLRERGEDVDLLTRFFLQQMKADDGRPDSEFTPLALDTLRRYAWPGNVRQLENEIRRAVTLTRGTIDVADLSDELRSGSR